MFTNNLVTVAISCDLNNKDAVNVFNVLYARYMVLYNCTEHIASCFKGIERSIAFASNIPIINLMKRYSKDFSLDLEKELAAISDEVKKWLSEKTIREQIVNNREDKSIVDGISTIIKSEDNKSQYFYATLSLGKWISSNATHISVDDLSEIKYGLLKADNVELNYIHLCPELNIKTKTDVCGEFFPQNYVYYSAPANYFSSWEKENDFFDFINGLPNTTLWNSTEEIENYFNADPNIITGELEFVM